MEPEPDWWWWEEARLIPISGINGRREQERRASSALLAVISAVKEFGRAILKPLGAPSGWVESYIEVPFELDGRRVRPDGLICVRRGTKTWNALVEVKTGGARLRRDQVEDYLDVARENEFDAVITISNQIVPQPGSHPVDVDGRKTRTVSLYHLSWARILSEAIMQREYRGVEDPDQAWILAELIRYLEDDRSGALAFEDMGESWSRVRNAVQARTLRASDPGAAEVASAWDQLIQFLALQLGQKLGADVKPLLGNGSLANRARTLVDSLVGDGTIAGALRIPHAASPVDITANLREQKVRMSVELAAPSTGRATTRVKWLTRQLDQAPSQVRIDAFAFHGRGSTSGLLRDVRDDPRLLISDPRRELRKFRVSLVGPAGSKRTMGKGSFIGSVTSLADDFYEQVVQNLREWVHPPPKLRRAGQTSAPNS